MIEIRCLNRYKQRIVHRHRGDRRNDPHSIRDPSHERRLLQGTGTVVHRAGEITLGQEHIIETYRLSMLDLAYGAIYQLRLRLRTSHTTRTTERAKNSKPHLSELPIWPTGSPTPKFNHVHGIESSG